MKSMETKTIEVTIGRNIDRNDEIMTPRKHGVANLGKQIPPKSILCAKRPVDLHHTCSEEGGCPL